MALTRKQRTFIEEYLRTWNATGAARAAGYSERTASEIGYENLRKPQIAAEIKRRLTEMTMCTDELLSRLAEQARGEQSRFIDDYGHLDIAAMKAAGKAHLIKGLKPTMHGLTIEFYDAQAALDKLARHHGLYNDRVKVVTWQDEVVDLLRHGELSPADVQAAYPDLAAEFLARAGIASPSEPDADRSTD